MPGNANLKTLIPVAAGLAILLLLYTYRGHHVTTSTASAGKAAEVKAMMVNLEVDGKPSLFVVLSADGSINRIGDGTAESQNPDMFIGKTDPAIFEKVRSHLTDSMLQSLGHSFRRKNPRGAACKLTLMFQFNDDKSAAVEYLYGAESQGPPKEVADFVRTAARETEEWYQQQIRQSSSKH